MVCLCVGHGRVPGETYLKPRGQWTRLVSASCRADARAIAAVFGSYWLSILAKWWTGMCRS